MKKHVNLWRAAKRFHQDDRGIEALQVVMILAVAAIALIAVKTVWEGGTSGGVKQWFNDLVDTVLRWTT